MMRDTRRRYVVVIITGQFPLQIYLFLLGLKVVMRGWLDYLSLSVANI